MVVDRAAWCKTRSPASVFLAVAIPLCLWMLWSAIWHPLFSYVAHSDFWEHAAAIKEWKSNLAAPGNPHLAVDVGSPRYMPFFFALTVLANVLDLSALQALRVAAVLNFVLLLTGIYLFFHAYFRNPWAPVVGLLVMLGVWGDGWTRSSEYELRTLFYVSSYPSMFVFALSLISFWVTIRVLRAEAPKLLPYVFLLLAFAVMVPSHPLAATFGIAGVGALCVSERRGSIARRGLVLLAVLAGAVLSELWPYFSTFELLMGNVGNAGGEVGEVGGDAIIWWNWLNFGFSLDFERPWTILSEHTFYHWSKILIGMGPALIGLPCVFYYLLRRRHGFILVGLAAMMVPYLGYLVAPVPLGFRYLFYVVFFLQLSIVAFAIEDLPNFLRKDRDGQLTAGAKLIGGTTALLIGGLFVGHVAMAASHFVHTALAREPVTTAMARLTPHIPNDAIVLAPTRVSWPLPAFTGKVVSMYNGNHFVADRYARRVAVDRFFAAPMAASDRLGIIERYGVTHILVPIETPPPGLLDFVASRGRKTATVRGFSLARRRSVFELFSIESRPGPWIAVYELDR